MSTLRLLIALVVTTSAGLGSAPAAASWSFGASNPSSVSSSGAGAGRTAGWNLKENVKRTAEPQAAAAEENVKSPRDPASGLATGKRLHKPLSTGVSSQ